MVVTARCFSFRALITQAWVFEMKTRQVYFIHTFPRRRELGESLQTCCVNVFFALGDIWREKNPYFEKHLFLQYKNWWRLQEYVYKTSQMVRINFQNTGGIKSYKDRLNRSTKPVVGIVKIFTLVKQKRSLRDRKVSLSNWDVGRTLEKLVNQAFIVFCQHPAWLITAVNP